MKLKNLLKDNFNYLKILTGVLLIYFCLFFQLDSMNLMDWDEARVAKSSYEMSKSNDFITVTYEGSPDFWSTKPSFLHIIQSIFIKCLGLSVLSVRLPSAICGLLVCWLLYTFLQRTFGNKLLSFLSVLIFVTAPAVIADNHSFRSADYDAMLVFTIFASSVSLFLFFEYDPKIKYLYYFFVFLLLGVLTKGIAGLFYLPGIVLYAFYKKQVLSIIKNKHFYFSFLCFIIPTLTYFFVREKLNPGYFQALNDNEIIGRYNNTHGPYDNISYGDFWYNFNLIIENRFNYFYFLIPCGFIIGIFSKNSTLKNSSVYSGLLIAGVFLIISFSLGKNIWYDLPMYPYMAILTAICLFYVFDFLTTIKISSSISSINLVPYLFLFVVLVFPYAKAISLINEPLTTHGPVYSYNNVLQDYIKQKRAKNNYVIALSQAMDLTQSQLFYVDMAKENKINLKVKKGIFANGDILITPHQQTQQEIERDYNFKLLEKYREINVYQIISRKQ